MAVDPEEAQLHVMSTLTEEGVMSVKQAACDRLLASRVETKLQVTALLWLCAAQSHLKGLVSVHAGCRYLHQSCLLQSSRS